jgi:hypothetical protein
MIHPDELLKPDLLSWALLLTTSIIIAIGLLTIVVAAFTGTAVLP